MIVGITGPDRRYWDKYYNNYINKLTVHYLKARRL